MLCYPFYRLQIKKHHALDQHLLPLRTSPWPFSIDVPVDLTDCVSEPHGKCILKACACVCVFSVRVQQSPVRYKAVMCLWSTPYHQILQQSTFYWFLCYFYKINNSAPSDIKNALISFFFIMLNSSEQKKKMHFLFYSLLRTVTYSFC